MKVLKLYMREHQEEKNKISSKRTTMHSLLEKKQFTKVQQRNSYSGKERQIIQAGYV